MLKLFILVLINAPMKEIIMAFYPVLIMHFLHLRMSDIWYVMMAKGIKPEKKTLIQLLDANYWTLMLVFEELIVVIIMQHVNAMLQDSRQH